MCQSVPNFISYVSAKYYLNWFTVGKVIAKIEKVNFLLRHSVHATKEQQTLLGMLAVALTISS